MSFREQPNNNSSGGEQSFKIQSSGQQLQQQQPSSSGAMQVSRISSLSDANLRPQQQPLVEHKLPLQKPHPSSTTIHNSPSSNRISSSTSSSNGRSSKAFKDLHEYLSDGTESSVTLHNLFSDKPTFFATPVNGSGRSSRFTLADSTTSSTTSAASDKSKNKRTLDDVEEEDRCAYNHQIKTFNLPLKIFGEQADPVVDETTRQRLYAENLKTIEQFLSTNADNSNSAQQPPPPSSAPLVSTSTTTDQQPHPSVMMDVDLPLL